MTTRSAIPSLALVGLLACGTLGRAAGPAPGVSLETPVPALPEILLHRGTCNAWVLRDGDAAIVVDPGDGHVLDALGHEGIRPEWILLTDHHRERCQGMARVDQIGRAHV